MFASMFNISSLHFLHNQYFQLVLGSLVQFIIGFKFYKNTYYAIKSKSLNMDVLIAMGTSAAYIYSVYLVFFKETQMGQIKHLYFESSAVIITLILLGKFLESKAKNKTSSAIQKLIGLKPKKARVLVKGIEQENY